jgi:large subunit ribosomal protein L18
MKLSKKQSLAQKRHWRVRRKISGTSAKPRLSVCFTNKHIYAQAIDDVAGKTLASACSTQKAVEAKANVAGAVVVGKQLAANAIAAGIREVVFDRGSRRYHGCVKAFADAAREAGLKF